MKKMIKFLLIVIATSIIFTNTSEAAGCDPPSATIDLDINNVRAKLLNGGDMFWDIFGSSSAAYEIPKNSGKHSTFTASLFFSGIDAGNNLYTAGQTYRQRGLDFWPGHLSDMGEISKIDCDDADYMYTVYGHEINNARAGKGISYNMSRWGNSNFQFYDKNNDGIYDPSFGDYPVYDLNNPNVIPAQLISWVINDKGGTHTVFAGPGDLGIEIITTAVAFLSNTSEIVNNSTIYKYRIINKSNVSYTEFRMGKFIDFELGNFSDDYVGCDLSTNKNAEKRNLFYVYNADNFDENSGTKGYGDAPPAFGVTFLNTSTKNNGTPLEMNSFIFLTSTGQQGSTSDPIDKAQLQNYLKGFWADVQPITYGIPSARGGADPTKFVFPGDTDPQGRPNWVESLPPSDRRSIITIEPRTLAPGEQMTVELAFIWARDTPGTNLTSLAKLRLSTDTLIEAYKTNFNSFSTGIVKTKNNKPQVLIYPNPANTFISMEGVGLVNDLKIYNSQGKLVMHVKNPMSTKVNIEELPQGTYVVKAGEYVGRFVKL